MKNRKEIDPQRMAALKAVNVQIGDQLAAIETAADNMQDLCGQLAIIDGEDEFGLTLVTEVLTSGYITICVALDYIRLRMQEVEARAVATIDHPNTEQKDG